MLRNLTPKGSINPIDPRSHGLKQYRLTDQNSSVFLLPHVL